VLIIGLTGSIGMGKSTTAGMFREMGVPVHDSDSAVHELYASTAVAPIATLFPDVVEDGVVNRDALGKRVLGSASALKKLEQIVHPLVSGHRQKFLTNAQAAGRPVCLLDIPLLFETGAQQSVDVVLVVSATAPVQKARVLARPGMTVEKFHAILSVQTPDMEKRRKAHWVIDTAFGIDSARRQVAGMLRTLSR